MPASLSEIPLVQLDGAPLDPARLDGKVVLFVNVASRCGFTPQYAGLQALYVDKAPKGLEIVGVPCNQFLWQEPGDADQIASFCKLEYGVTFPLLEKQEVNGSGRSPLYAWLVGSDVGGGRGVKWNFEKFLVDRGGRVVGRYGPNTTPDDPAMNADIDRALAAPR